MSWFKFEPRKPEPWVMSVRFADGSEKWFRYLDKRTALEAQERAAYNPRIHWAICHPDWEKCTSTK